MSGKSNSEAEQFFKVTNQKCDDHQLFFTLQSINQSINQSVNQSINQSINQSHDHIDRVFPELPL